MDTFISKCEQKYSTEGSTFQYSNSNATQAQIMNIELINCLWKLKNCLWSLVEQFQQDIFNESGQTVIDCIADIVEVVFLIKGCQFFT